MGWRLKSTRTRAGMGGAGRWRRCARDGDGESGGDGDTDEDGDRVGVSAWVLAWVFAVWGREIVDVSVTLGDADGEALGSHRW